MVGVPGKSKGCSTCRRRKKGCDQRRPICGQCAQSGYECGGYNRDLTFIIHPASKTVHKAYFLPHQQRSPSTSPLTAFGSSLDQTAIKYQCRGLFWDLYLPKGDCVIRDEAIVKCGHPTNWTEMVNGLDSDETSLQTAFSALSISRVGRENKDVRFVRESTKAYGKALRDLQEALSDKKRAHSDEVLAACMIMSLYEVFENSSTSALGWVSHAEGAARLIEIRGPERHQNWHTHHIFLGARTPIIYAAMMRRKPTFLGEQSWLTIPWGIEHKTYFDRNIDMATQIPGLLHESDNLQDQYTDDDELYGARRGLLQRCKQLLTGMTKWHNGMKKGSQWALVKHETLEDDLYPFDAEMSFPNHLFANAHMIFWTCSLVLSDAIEDIQAAIYGSPRQVDDGTSGSSPTRHFATQTAMSVLYFLQPEMGGLGASMLNFPVAMTYHYFHRSNEDHICKWLKKVFSDAQKRGLNIGRTVTAFFEEQDLDRAMIDEDLSDPSSDMQDFDDKPAVVKRQLSDSGDESSDAASPFSTSSSSSSRTTWVYEDPSKYYIESS